MNNMLKLSIFDYIKLLTKNPHLIKTTVKEWRQRRKADHIEKMKREVYNWEKKTHYDVKLSTWQDVSYTLTYPNRKMAILNPVLSVYREIEMCELGSFYVRMLNIHCINVDTQNENKVTVIIHLERPGLLIGKAGTTIDNLANNLTKLFGVKTEIEIIEVKENINKPIFIEY